MFFFLDKKEPIRQMPDKTQNSFRAKATAINLLRDPSRQGMNDVFLSKFPLPCLPDRSAGLRT
jgi:hypothetical protein